MLRRLTHKIWTLLTLPLALVWIGTACSSGSGTGLPDGGGTTQPGDRDTDGDGILDRNDTDDDGDGISDDLDDDDDGDGISDDKDDDGPGD